MYTMELLRLRVKQTSNKSNKVAEKYRTVKNFGGKKIWRIESLQSIGEKIFGE